METMALVVTDGKNDKTEQNDQESVHNKRTRDWTFLILKKCFVCVALFCGNR